MACAGREQSISAAAAATGAAISNAAAMVCAAGWRASSIAVAQCAGAGYVLTLERFPF